MVINFHFSSSCTKEELFVVINDSNFPFNSIMNRKQVTGLYQFHFHRHLAKLWHAIVIVYLNAIFIVFNLWTCAQNHGSFTNFTFVWPIGESMDYEITLPLIATINYPGPSKTIRILSSCVWSYHHVGTGDTTFFSYDSLNKFSFGLRSGTKMISTINHSFSSSRYGPNIIF